jgi:hypothetical protein
VRTELLLAWAGAQLCLTGDRWRLWQELAVAYVDDLFGGRAWADAEPARRLAAALQGAFPPDPAPHLSADAVAPGAAGGNVVGGTALGGGGGGGGGGGVGGGGGLGGGGGGGVGGAGAGAAGALRGIPPAQARARDGSGSCLHHALSPRVQGAGPALS